MVQVWLAKPAPISFEVVAAWTYYALATVIVWVPLRDTAGAMLMTSVEGNRLMTIALYTTPVVPTLAVICGQASLVIYGENHDGGGEDRARASAERSRRRGLVDAFTLVFGSILLRIGIPMLLYALRRQAARQLRTAAAASPTASEPRQLSPLALAARRLKSCCWPFPSSDAKVHVSPSGEPAAAAPEHDDDEDEPFVPEEEEEGAFTQGDLLMIAKARRSLGAAQEAAQAPAAQAAPAAPVDSIADVIGIDDERRAVMARRIAMRVHAWWKGRLAKRRIKKEIEMRRARLLRFYHPIFWASLCFVITTEVVHQLRWRSVVSGNTDGADSLVLWQLLFALPCVLIVGYDVNKNVRFSFTHCVFFATVLYPLAFAAIDVDRAIWNRLERAAGVGADADSSIEAGRPTWSILGAELPVDTLITMASLCCHCVYFVLISAGGCL